MVEIGIWIIVGFISGSIPWALLVSRLIVGQDIRKIGDGNPGTVNSWKLGGWVPGSISLLLEIGKGLIPVYLATYYLTQQPTSTMLEIGLAMITLAPIVGHGWSPFLGLKGGKSIAVSGGAWIAVTGGSALPVACVLGGLSHGLQKNHAITVTFCLVGLLAVFLPIHMQVSTGLFGVGNLMIILFKHRSEYSLGVIRRDWVLKLARPST